MQVQISISGESRLLPTSWEAAGELAWPCLKDLVRYGADEGKLRSFKRLADLSTNQMRSLKDEQLAAISIGFDWISISPVMKMLKDRFTCRGIEYTFPSEKFGDGSAIMFAIADEYFQQYSDGDDEALLLLMATLSSPLEEGKRKPLLDRKEVIDRAKTLRCMAPEWLAETWMYWAGIKQYVNDTYGKWLFQQNESDEEEEDGSAPVMEEILPNFGWWGKFMEVAETGVFGDLNQVNQTNFHTICVLLVKKEIEYRRHKQAMTQQKI